jgi:hypothetical protein
MVNVNISTRNKEISVISNITSMLTRAFSVLLIMISIGLTEQAKAQDLEPRRWSHLPTGLNIVGLGYSYTEADIFFSPVLKITDGTSRVNGLGLSVMHAFDLAGKSARISMLLPYASGRWQGKIDGEFQTVYRQGVGDPRLRFSVNLYGAPALKGAEYLQYRAEHPTNTIIGASIAATAPLGKYCDDCLINIGNNRWSLRPQIGVVHTRGPWSFELTGSVFMFTDNDSFVDNAVLQQKKVFTMQTHVTYSFAKGVWASIGTAYGSGGRIKIEQTKTAFEVDNWVRAASFGLPIGKTQSFKLMWLTGRTQNLAGRDSDNLFLSWATRWRN